MNKYMANSNDGAEQKVVIEDADISHQDFTPEEGADESSIDWKAKFIEAQGIAKRRATKLAKVKETLSKVNEKPPVDTTQKDGKKPSGLDYGQKAFLVANGIKGSDEMAFVQEFVDNTGKSIEEVLESTYFQAELKERREKQATKDATPSSQKRSGNAASDTVEYWLAKGTLPPMDQRELRQKVVNAKIKAQSSGNPFTNNPVIQ